MKIIEKIPVFKAETREQTLEGFRKFLPMIDLQLEGLEALSIIITPFPEKDIRALAALELERYLRVLEGEILAKKSLQNPNLNEWRHLSIKILLNKELLKLQRDLILTILEG